MRAIDKPSVKRGVLGCASHQCVSDDLFEVGEWVCRAGFGSKSRSIELAACVGLLFDKSSSYSLGVSKQPSWHWRAHGANRPLGDWSEYAVFFSPLYLSVSPLALK
jgi:hypothetical protein